MNKIAIELNEIINEVNTEVLNMLSDLGKNLYFPKGILSQSGEAKLYAKKYNATIGIGKSKGNAISLKSVMKSFDGISENDILPYAPSPGRPDLRNKWKELIYKKNPSLNNILISTPLVTNGITHGLSLAADLFTDIGDTIITSDKMWGNYNLIFGVRKKVEFEKFELYNNDNKFNIEAFENIINEQAEQKDKIVALLNFPNNPTGYSITETEASQIADILIKATEKSNVICILDDAYFGLFYEEDNCKESVFAKVANASEKLLAVKLDGATKEDYVWGFRTGFITFGTKNVAGIEKLYLAMEKKAAGGIRGNISNCPNVSQSILLKAFEDENYWTEKQEKFELLKERALKVKEILKNEKFSEVWNAYNFNSGYFMCVKLIDINAEELRVHLLKEYQTGTIAINDTDLRIAFSSVDVEDLEDLFETIYSGCKDLKK